MAWRTLVLDGAARKAARVLRARLGRLGWRVLGCRATLADDLIAWMAERGAFIATSDKRLYERLASRGLRVAYVPPQLAGKLNSRCLATRIIKELLGAAGPG